jgi:serine/threonine protein kinase
VRLTDDNDLISSSLGPTTYTPPEKKIPGVTFYSGKAADMWCCGVTLYHMVFKKPLFSKNNKDVDIDK